MSPLRSAKQEKIEAICLLQVGTFLEFFDLMLFVHMAIILNELFFPKTDPHTTSLLAAFAFCSTFVMRPFGAFLFGYLGDYIGRKATVILTTMMMALSCIVMANLPTYAQIGIAATWAVTICRILQGLASMGEVTGAKIYLTEMIKPPARYPVVALIGSSSAVGGMMALAVASLVTGSVFNWRMAFWVGAGIALVGTLARTRLRETPDFADMKRRAKQAIEIADENGLTKAAELLRKTHPLWNEIIDKKTLLAYFLIECPWPAVFYFSYIYCGSLLKNSFGYTGAQVIHNNFILSVLALAMSLFFALLSYKIHPLKILKAKAMGFMPFILVLPHILQTTHWDTSILIIQTLTLFFGLSGDPAYGCILIHLPVFRRFTLAGLSYAVTRALMYIITSFGLVYLTNFFDHWGVLVIMVPLSMGFIWGVCHFEKLEGLIGPSGPLLFNKQKGMGQ